MVKVFIPVQPVDLVDQGVRFVGLKPGGFARIDDGSGTDVGVVTNPLWVWLLAHVSPDQADGFVFVLESTGTPFNSINDEVVNPQEF